MKLKSQIMLFLLMVLLAVTLQVVIKNTRERIQLKEKRERLAKIMNISLEEYPKLPDDYFPEKLKPGIALEDVHQIVIGYEKAYYDYRPGALAYYEIYSYFSTEENKADRIQIIYNSDYEVVRFDQEDDDSRTLTTEGWPEGQLIRR